MSLKLYPEEITTMCSDIVTKMDSLAGEMENTNGALDAFDSSTNLTGAAWNSAKNQMDAYRLVIKGIVSACDTMSMEACRLSASVGSENLDEDELNDAKADMEEQLKSDTEMYWYYKQNNGNKVFGGTVCDYSDFIWNYSLRMNSDKAILNKIKEKIERLYKINSSTSNAFSESNKLFSIVYSISNRISGGYSSGRFHTEIDLIEAGIINSAWDKTKNERKVRREGVSISVYEETKSNLQNYGFTDEEIDQLFELINDEKDINFINAVSKGYYGKATRIASESLPATYGIILESVICKLQEKLVTEGDSEIEQKLAKVQELQKKLEYVYPNGNMGSVCALTGDYQSIVYGGKAYPVYVPDYCTPAIDNTTWETVEVIRLGETDFDWTKAISNFGLSGSTKLGADPIFTYKQHVDAGVSLLAGALDFIDNGTSYQNIYVVLEEDAYGNTRSYIGYSSKKQSNYFAHTQYGVPVSTYGQLNGNMYQYEYSEAVKEIYQNKTGVENAGGTGYDITCVWDRAHQYSEVQGYLSFDENGNVFEHNQYYAGDRIYITKRDIYGITGEELLDITEDYRKPNQAGDGVIQMLYSTLEHGRVE